MFVLPIHRAILKSISSYFDVIKDPMDLSTMGAKLEEGMYKDRFAFQADFRLMISNAKRYNTTGSFVHNEAIALEIFFEKRTTLLLIRLIVSDAFAAEWTIINKTLEANDKAHPPAIEARPAPRVLPPVPKAFTSPPPPPASAPVASASRPSIKLKVNPQSKVADSTEQRAPKFRSRRPKVVESNSTDAPAVDAPPPPYVDDGSHDILQEVLAIEREKDERRQRSTSEKEKDKLVLNGASSKRKKGDASVDEDDILALAAPLKKERPSPPGPSSTIQVKVVPPTTKPVPSISNKAKKDKPVDSTTNSSDAPRISVKGKEKEVVSSPASSSQPAKPKKPPAVQSTPVNEKKCKDILKALQKLPEAVIFARPVDPILDGCPT